MTDWEPELCESYPLQFEKIGNDRYIQRTNIHDVEYHSLNDDQVFKGYECFRREISYHEYLVVQVHKDF